MTAPISIGDEAPNFDLSSTEDALLMLKDECARTGLVLYFFTAADDRVLRDLEALNGQLDALARRNARVLAVSKAPLDELRRLQAEKKLLFPLLHDDRNFSAAYGVDAPEGRTAAPALAVVSRRQRILWLANPVAPVAEAMPQVLGIIKGQPSPIAGYPKSVINRIVDRWVN